VVATTVEASGSDWDLTAYFDELDQKAYRRFRRALGEDTEVLLGEARALAPLDTSSMETWVALLVRLEDVSARSGHLASYLGCLRAADSRDELAQREAASAAAARVELEKVFVELRERLRDADDAAFAALLAAPSLAGATHFLERMRERARTSMSGELETLAAELDVTGLSAWGRLYSQMSARLEFDLAVPGQEVRRLPVAMTRSLLEDANAEVRRAAQAGANRAWEGVADTTAACLNAISGTRLALYRRRGIDHFLEPALRDADISRRTLDVLLDTVRSRREIARRYLRRKAGILGRDRLGFQDTLAPLPLSTGRIPWQAGRQQVLRAFGKRYPALAAFAQDAFERRWIDHTPRAGKAPGGFCTSSAVIDESRVFLTYNGAPGDVSTLAHELGHAFHGFVMRGMRPWSRRYPMTLAETASTFAEQVVTDEVLSDPGAGPEERAVVLDGRLADAAVFLLNIPMRFQFEKAVYEERSDGELPVTRLCALMREAQRDSFGDALAQDELDPWYWASKLHFYITGITFYNFPYTFGYLFSLGIFARAQESGPDFLPRYESLLRETGSGTAEEVARRALGIDLTTPDFWNASIDLIERDLELFLPLADALFGQPAGV
jgi:oligoendopeptidase F